MVKKFPAKCPKCGGTQFAQQLMGFVPPHRDENKIHCSNIECRHYIGMVYEFKEDSDGEKERKKDS